jgi:vacuolar-type H+-ATPase subunit H
MAAVPAVRRTPEDETRHRGGATADRVGSILSAAEVAADRIRSDAEARVRDRIAEGDRAAGYRVQAAEEEAAEILAGARTEAERLLREARERDEEAKTTATSEALTIIGKAQQNAEETLSQASASAGRTRLEAESYSSELLSEARVTAQEVRSEGLELVANLRQMGDSLRANAERILRDVQGIHSQMVVRIDRAEARRSSGAEARRPRSEGSRGTPRAALDAHGDADIPDVPEFIPRR